MHADPKTPARFWDELMEPPKQQNWGSLLLVAFLLGWISVTTAVVYPVAWGTEQMMTAVGQDWPVWVWPLIALGHVLLLLAPLAPLAWWWRAPRYRAVFQTWAVAAIFVIFLLPVRFAPPNAAQTAALLQIGGTLTFLAFVALLIWRRQKHGDAGFVKPQAPYLPALLLIPFLAYGWLAWGALGSPLDSLLNLLAALLFGLAAGLVFGHFLLFPLQRASNGPGWDITLVGFVIGAGLVMMGAGFGFNGLQLFLMFTLPALGWTVAAISRFGREMAATGWLTLSLLIGLATAAPMTLVDPDELGVVLNAGARDVFQWSFYAALVMIFAGWLLGFLLFLLRRRLPGWRARPLLIGGTTAAWLAGGLLYFLAGQPGFYGDRLFVILKDQADLSTAVTMPEYNQRRQYVYDTLTNHAGATQAGIRATLDRFRIAYQPYYLVNAIEVDAGPLTRLWLNTRPEVDRILHSPTLRPLPAPIPATNGSDPAPSGPQWNLTAIGADRVWGELGVTGEGIIVGQSDSGAQWEHPQLSPTYRGRDGEHDYNWLDPWNHTIEPTDIGGHGTHTLGSILGQTVGVAPGAQWYGCVNLARNLGNPPRYLDCLQFMLAPFPLDGDPLTGGDPAMGAHVINNSWGCPQVEGCDPTALLDAVRGLRAAGVFVVASTGNEGSSCSSVDDPIALYDESFSVGAMDESGRLAEFSSRGPVTADGSDRIKPDIIAPGVGILSANPGNTYAYSGGTSMAGPHIAGVVALIWSANPNLIGDIDRTETILTETAQPYDYERFGYPACAGDGSYPNNAVGYGVVDAYAAVRWAMQESGR